MASTIYTLRCISQEDYTRILETGYVFTVNDTKEEQALAPNPLQYAQNDHQELSPPPQTGAGQSIGAHDEKILNAELVSTVSSSKKNKVSVTPSRKDCISYLDKNWISFKQRFDGFV